MRERLTHQTLCLRFSQIAFDLFWFLLSASISPEVLICNPNKILLFIMHLLLQHCSLQLLPLFGPSARTKTHEHIAVTP